MAIDVGSLECGANAVGLARIEVETGAQVVLGDTERRVHPSPNWGGPRDRKWQVVLKRIGGGPVLINGSVRIPGPNVDSYAHFERVLRLGFEGDRVVVLEDRPVVQIAVKNGQAFRYGGEYPVAVDLDDLQSPSGFDFRADLVEGGTIECRACGLSEAAQVDVVVTVGKNGTVTWIRPTPISGMVDGRVWNAVRNGLQRYRFRPAVSQGRPVADYAVLHVRVVPGS